MGQIYCTQYTVQSLTGSLPSVLPCIVHVYLSICRLGSVVLNDPVCAGDKLLMPYEGESLGGPWGALGGSWYRYRIMPIEFLMKLVSGTIV